VALAANTVKGLGIAINAVSAIVTSIGAVAVAMVQIVVDVIGGLIKFVASGIDAVGKTISNLPGKAGAVGDAIQAGAQATKNAIDATSAALGTAIDVLAAQAQVDAQQVKDAFNEPWPADAVREAFALIKAEANAASQAILDARTVAETVTAARDPAADAAALTALTIKQAQDAAAQKLAIDEQLNAALLLSEAEKNAVLLELAVQLAEQKVLAEAEATAAARAAAGLDPLAADPAAEAKAQADALVAVAKNLVARQEALRKTAINNLKKGLAIEAKFEDIHSAARIGLANRTTSALVAIGGKGAKLAVAADKAKSIKQAVMNTAVAVTNALANVPFPGNIAAAAAMAALGAAEIATISGVIGGGGGGGGASSPGIGTPPDVFAATTPDLAEDTGPTGATARESVQIIFQGDVIGWDEHIEERVIASIRDVVENKDVILIGNTSRNALDLGEVVA
jgi:hypothetical protein